MQPKNTLLVLALSLIVLTLSIPSQSTETCSDQRVETYSYSLNGTFAQILFATDDKQEIYIRTYPLGHIYRSQNGGETWEPQMSKMRGFYEPTTVDEPEKLSGVTLMKKGAADGLVYFIGTGHIYWITDGDGFYHDYHLGQDTLLELAPHPSNPDLVLRSCRIDDTCNDHRNTNCVSQLEISHSRGEDNSWELVRKEVFEFSWGEGNQIYFIGVNETSSFAESSSEEKYPKNERYLFITEDFGASFSQQSGPGFYSFRFTQGVIYVFSVDPSTSQEILYISDDFGATYVPVEFNKENAKMHYNATQSMLLDSSEGVSFITMCESDDPNEIHQNEIDSNEIQNEIDQIGQVNQNLVTRMGDMFSSPTSDGRFALTFPHHRIQCDSLYNTADFSLIQGMFGVYIANGYNLTNYNPKKDDIEDFIETSITFNKGGIWQHLPPVSDECKSTPECKLNLVDKSDKKYSVKIQSTESAVGLVTAVGNEGIHRRGFSESLETYLSRNGGFSWEKIHDQALKTFISPRGDLLLGVRNQETTLLSWSWDQGLHWEECDFGVELFPIEFQFASEDPSLKRVLLIGQTSRYESLVLLFDFSSILPRYCVNFENPNEIESDYEEFIPETEGSCLLGSRVSYIRRKQTSECVSPTDEQSTLLGTCECTRSDFTCSGDCFQETTLPAEEQLQTGFSIGCINICLGQPNDPQAPSASQCTGSESGFYLQQSGYARVEGDRCAGGLQLDVPRMAPCPVVDVDDSAGEQPEEPLDDEEASSASQSPALDTEEDSDGVSSDQESVTQAESLGDSDEDDDGWWWIVAVSVILASFAVFSVVGGVVFYHYEHRLQGIFSAHVLPLWRKPRQGGRSYYDDEESGQSGTSFDLDDLAWENSKPASPSSSKRSTPLGPLPELYEDDESLEYTEFPPYQDSD